MDVFDAIAKRYSHRGEFTDALVPKGPPEHVQAGIQAPSAKNEQVVTFVAVDDPRLLQQIAEIVDNRPVCRSAKAMVACVIDPRPVLGGITFAPKFAAAVENMLLAITSLVRQRLARRRLPRRRARRPTAGRAGGSGRCACSCRSACRPSGASRRERLPFFRRAGSTGTAKRRVVARNHAPEGRERALGRAGLGTVPRRTGGC